MKIVKTEGCVADSIKVDGVDLESLDGFTCGVMISRVFRLVDRSLKCKDQNKLSDLLDMIEPTLFEVDDTPCSQCGDYVRETTWEV